MGHRSSLLDDGYLTFSISFICIQSYLNYNLELSQKEQTQTAAPIYVFFFSTQNANNSRGSRVVSFSDFRAYPISTLWFCVSQVADDVMLSDSSSTAVIKSAGGFAETSREHLLNAERIWFNLVNTGSSIHSSKHLLDQSVNTDRQSLKIALES